MTFFLLFGAPLVLLLVLVCTPPPTERPGRHRAAPQSAGLRRAAPAAPRRG